MINEDGASAVDYNVGIIGDFAQTFAELTLVNKAGVLVEPHQIITTAVHNGYRFMVIRPKNEKRPACDSDEHPDE